MIRTAPPPTPPPGEPYATCGFPPEVESVGASRRWLRATFEDLGIDWETAVQVLSELVTNAVMHARSKFEVRCYRPRGGYILMEVADWDPRLPQQRAPQEWEESGRGLLLVELLAECWETRADANGKAVCVCLKALECV